MRSKVNKVGLYGTLIGIGAIVSGILLSYADASAAKSQVYGYAVAPDPG